MPVCATILVIEDDQAIREAIQCAVEAEGFDVITAGDGKEGIEVLRTVKKPCLILLDLMMPVMNGWEFIDWIRRDPDSILATVPVVITSAAGLSAASAVHKVEGYIKKPIDLKLLHDTIRKFCSAGWHSAKFYG